MLFLTDTPYHRQHLYKTGAIAKANVKPLFHDDYRQSLGETLREKLDLVASMHAAKSINNLRWSYLNEIVPEVTIGAEF